MDIYPTTKLDNDILDLSSFNENVFYSYGLLPIIEYLIETYKLVIIGINLNYTNFYNYSIMLSEILKAITNIKIISIKQYNVNQFNPTTDKEIRQIFIDNNFIETELRPSSCIWIKNDVKNKDELLEQITLTFTHEFNHKHMFGW
jgi:hypothetical protein